MRKFLILIFALPFLAASCDLSTGSLDLGASTRGIFKSTDAGASFNLSSKFVKKGDISNLSINALSFDPNNYDVLYAGSGSGIYKTENAADAWKYTLSGLSVSSVAVDSTNNQIIYASGLADRKGKIIKTADGGSSWVDIYTEPSKNNTVLSLAISKSNSSVVLAGLTTGEVIRSTDAGVTWQAVQDLADKVILLDFGSNNEAYALTSTKGLFKSTDAGKTWQSASSQLIEDTISSSSQAISSVTNFYSLALDLRHTQVLYLGTEQGLYRSMDDGKTWNPMALPVKNAALRVSSVSVDPTNSDTLYASIASTLYKSINGGLTWETKVLPTSAVIREILINPNSTNIIYLGLRSN